jgi:hypothetical protein
MSGLIPIILIGVMALFLVLHEQYEDGFIGRIALGGIVLAVVIVLLTHTGGWASYAFAPELTLLLWAICVFIARHVYRFWRYSKHGLFQWRREA